jgi:hypothetical protein
VRESCSRYQRTGHDKQPEDAGGLHRRKAIPASAALANNAWPDVRTELQGPRFRRAKSGRCRCSLARQRPSWGFEPCRRYPWIVR